jgi:lipoprotein signal peptidase
LVNHHHRYLDDRLARRDCLSKNWARYFLIILLIIAVVGTFIILPELLKSEITSPVLFTVLCLTTVLNAGIAWCLISAPSIRES